MTRYFIIAAVLVVVIVVAIFVLRRQGKPKSPELTLVEGFYRKYLANWKPSDTPPRKTSDLPYSKSFSDLIDLHDKTCADKHEKIGGWGVDEDVFLDSSQIDPGLTLQNSRLAVSEPSPGLVEVRLNVAPSEKNAGDSFDRSVQFQVIQEDGKWVVDDIISGSKGNLSARKEIQERINKLNAK
jgi:hypothetical protein